MDHTVAIESPPGTFPYEGVVRQQAGHVYRVALGVVRDPSLAEDASQEAFLALLARQEPFPSQAALRGWLGKVSFNAGLRILRSRRRRHKRELTVGVQDSGEARAMDETMASEARELRRMVDDLPVELRTAIRLKYFQDIPQREIADVMGCSTGTVSNRIRLGLERLRRSAARAGYAGLVPVLETRLSLLEPDLVPSHLVPRLLTLETAAPLTTASGGMTMLTKIIFSGAALLATALGVGFVGSRLMNSRVNGEDGAGSEPVGIARASPDVEGRPRLEGRAIPDGGERGEVAPPASPSAGRVARAESTALRGIVRLPNGRPAEGARIRVESPTKMLPSVRRTAQADAQGGWLVDGLPHLNGWIVSIRLDGAAPWRLRYAVPDSSAEHIIESDLHASWSIRGILRDEHGEPIAGQVPLTLSFGSSSGSSTLVVDADGHFTIRDLNPKKQKPDTTELTFRHPEHVPYTMAGWAERIGPDGWAHVDVRLKAGSRVKGAVRDPQGRPLPKASLILLPAGVEPSQFSWDRREFTTDARGAYRLPGLGDGDYVLRAKAKGLVLETPLRFTVANQDTLTHDLVLGPGRTILGKLLDVNGRPITMATIERSDLYDLMGADRPAALDRDGRFRFEGVAMERRRVQLWLSELPISDDKKLDVRVVRSSPRLVEVEIRTPLPLAEPAADEVDTPSEDDTPVQVMIPNESVEIVFPEGR